MKSELFKAGWNLRVENADAKLPRDCKKNQEFIDGFRACESKFMEAIALSIRTQSNPVYPGKLM